MVENGCTLVLRNVVGSIEGGKILKWEFVDIILARLK